MPDFIPTMTAARMLGVSRATILRWVHTGRLGAERVGGRYRVRRVDVEALPRPVLPHARESRRCRLTAWERRTLAEHGLEVG